MDVPKNPLSNMMLRACPDGTSAGSRPVRCPRAMSAAPSSKEKRPTPPQTWLICSGRTRAARPFENTPYAIALLIASTSPSGVFTGADGSTRFSCPSTAIATPPMPQQTQPTPRAERRAVPIARPTTYDQTTLLEDSSVFVDRAVYIRDKLNVHWQKNQFNVTNTTTSSDGPSARCASCQAWRCPHLLRFHNPGSKKTLAVAVHNVVNAVGFL
mmetsp:Transcript_92904/g.284384  ORF Transcript_92904/g.284384 Transcript_92904/m.284384 type:complete len:213 (-) Transcript_92904:274-912(-)